MAASVERSGISAAILYTDARSACDIKSWLEPALDTYSGRTLESF